MVYRVASINKCKALYMWYYGGDVVNNWGIQKHVLRTDADLEEAVFEINEPKSNMTKELEYVNATPETTDDIENQLKFLDTPVGKMLYTQWLEEMKAADDAAMQKILSTPQGREAYERQFHTKLSTDENGATTIPLSVYDDFNNGVDPMEQEYKVVQGNLSHLWDKL